MIPLNVVRSYKIFTSMSALARPFYISTQLVNYLREANYGNGLAMIFSSVEDEKVKTQIQKLNGRDPKVWTILAAAGWDQKQILETLQTIEDIEAAKIGRTPEKVDVSLLNSIDVTQSLDLVFDQHIASTAILIMLFALIESVGDLRSRINRQRIHYDELMLKHFFRKTNTRWFMHRNGEEVDVTNTLQPEMLRDPSAYPAKVQNVDKSAFQRLRELPSTQSQRPRHVEEINAPVFVAYNPEGSDDWGFLRSMYMVVISYFKIPDEVLTIDERGRLQSVIVDGVETNPVYIDNENLKAYLRRLVDAHRQRDLPAKRAALQARRVAAAEAEQLP